MNTFTNRAPIAFSSRRVRGGFPMLIGGLLAVVALALIGLFIYDRSQSDSVAPGVRIDGVNVSGMSRAAATRKVQGELVAPLTRTITVQFRGRTWQMSGAQAHASGDAAATVDRAIAVGRGGWFVSRGLRGLFGIGLNRNIPLQVNVSQPVVLGLANQVTQAVDRPAQNAQVAPNASGLGTIPERPGVRVRTNLLSARITTALTHPNGPATVLVPTAMLRPTVTTSQLAAHYPAYILVDRSNFTLRFYSHLKLRNTFPIAVGMQGLETPGGLYHIQWKQTDPPWYVPNDSWAGSLAGQVIPPGPEDPLKARFMSFDGGAGIHGIDPSEYDTIGQDASHGCIRMRIPDVINLYSKSPVGTPVYIL